MFRCAFPRDRHSFDFILELYQIFRFVTIPIEKAISQVICTPFTGQTSKGGIYYALLI